MGMSRRDVLAALGAVTVAAATRHRGWGAERRPVKVGWIAPFTGPFAQNAKNMWDGFRLYFEEIGMQAAGRKIELISEDSWVEPAQALTKVRQLVEKDHVHVIAGGLLAPTAFALQPYVNSQRIPFVIPTMSADDITQRKMSGWYVRAGASNSQITHPFGDYAYKTLGYRKVAGINLDILSGYESFHGFQRVFRNLGGNVVQKLWVPATVSDFASYLSTLTRDVDAVFVTIGGDAARQFLNQAVAYGIRGKIPIIGQGILTDEGALPSMGDDATGVLTSFQYSAALDNAANRRFVAAYRKLSGKLPGYYSAMSYTAGRFIVEALKTVGGNVEDREAYVAALKKVEIPDDPRGPMKLDQWGNPIQNIYIRKVERVGGELQNTVIHTYRNVSQFWTYRPEEFLKGQGYGCIDCCCGQP